MHQENQSSTRYFAVVPAAGSGSRMESEKPKQYLAIGDKTILEHTLQVLLSARQIDQIIVCLAEHDPHWAELDLAEPSRIDTVTGGASRAQSVLNGLNHLAGKAREDDWVIVHDAARPCLSPTLLHRFIDDLEGDEVGGILAVQVRDTLKKAHLDSDYIEKTLDRAQIWQAQTPQMFRYGLLYSALQDALARQLEVTDEAAAMEASGLPVRLVKGDSRNIKVTTAEDLLFARSILEIALQ
jgi:2-C-methyl-D-erythritol 4-phosphate cytidylyltransferase